MAVLTETEIASLNETAGFNRWAGFNVVRARDGEAVLERPAGAGTVGSV